MRDGVFGRKVVVIDDQSTGRTVLSKIIVNAFEAEVTGFDSAEKALKWLESNKAELVVTDYNMPGCNGLELVSRVRKIELNRDTPVVMISVQLEDNLRKTAESLGVKHFIPRPIDQQSCIEAFKEYLK